MWQTSWLLALMIRGIFHLCMFLYFKILSSLTLMWKVQYWFMISVFCIILLKGKPQQVSVNDKRKTIHFYWPFLSGVDSFERNLNSQHRSEKLLNVKFQLQLAGCAVLIIRNRNMQTISSGWSVHRGKGRATGSEVTQTYIDTKISSGTGGFFLSLRTLCSSTV